MKATPKLHLNGLRQHETDIRVETVDMTPDKAMELLANADPNRTVHQRRVGAYTRNMVAGHWRVNGETVKLAPDGKLIDGEHRLWAVVKAGDMGIKSVPMMVAFNVPRDVRQTVDTGKARSYTDVLKIRGYGGKGRVLASTMRYIALYRAGALSPSGIGGRLIMTHEELDAIYEDADALARVEFFIETYAHGMRFAPAVGFVYWRGSQDDEEVAQDWAYGVKTGTEMAADDPRYQLRERFHEPSKRTMGQEEAIGLAIKSYNLFVLGEKVPNLRWRSRGNSAEAFPVFLSDQKASSRTGLKPDERRVLMRHAVKKSTHARAGAGA